MKRQACQQRQAAPETRALAAARAALPIAPYRAEILEAIATRQVVLIAGETGCGKTTQARDCMLDPETSLDPRPPRSWGRSPGGAHPGRDRPRVDHTGT